MPALINRSKSRERERTTWMAGTGDQVPDENMENIYRYFLATPYSCGFLLQTYCL